MSATNSDREPATNRGWPAQDDAVDPQAVLGALEDDACRAILEATSDEGFTATELSEQCDIPTSTAYRKVEQLAEADLVDERIRINTSGKHATEYHRSFGDVVVSVADGGVSVELTTPEADANSDSFAAVADD